MDRNDMEDIEAIVGELLDKKLAPIVDAIGANKPESGYLAGHAAGCAVGKKLAPETIERLVNAIESGAELDSATPFPEWRSGFYRALTQAEMRNRG